jgi:hypothetical protein
LLRFATLDRKDQNPANGKAQGCGSGYLIEIDRKRTQWHNRVVNDLHYDAITDAAVSP